jgi:L-alanine-DL-glutamate epimerase-like enolase superfamily enzyme
MKIKEIRAILLSSPYAQKGENLEVDFHLQSGYRTTGLVEITLDNGITGLGEAYLAVFAPKVFVEIVKTITPYLIDVDITEIEKVMERVSLVTGYWSLQGAAQHVVSAFDIALHDCKAKVLGIPVFKMLNKRASNTIELYGSGGDSSNPEFMDKEFDYLDTLGIKFFKIRARNNQIKKAAYVFQKARQKDIRIAIDMTQNLANPGQRISEIIDFYNQIADYSSSEIFFFEEVLGPSNGDLYPELRKKIPVRIAGGEIVTTVSELSQRIDKGWYDIAQPDATVIGGISAVNKIFKKALDNNVGVFVHCWGGSVCMAANYHAALASGGKIAEWPMPYYPLRDAMMVEPWNISNGILIISDAPGLGIKLTKEIEKEFKFRENAVYSCIPGKVTIKENIWNI